MEVARTSYRSAAGDRRLEIVSGKGFGGARQMYASSPDDVPPPVNLPRRNQVASKPWGGFSDPEMKRRKRVAKYKVYSIEGRVKASFKNGFRWIKTKCSEFIHGY